MDASLELGKAIRHVLAGETFVVRDGELVEGVPGQPIRGGGRRPPARGLP